MDEEMRLHLEMLTEHNLKAGMSHEDAHYAAQRRFGGVEQIKERARDERTWMWMEDIWRDLRFSFRSLRRASGFSAAVVTTLALCIGANTAITSVLYSLVLKPLPYHDANQVVEIYNSQSKSTQVKHRMSLAQYLDYKAQANLFSSVALLNGWMFNTGDNSEADRLLGIRVTHDYFEVLGVQPLLGRFFTAEECEPGKDDVVVLTQTFWETNYRGDPSVVGREVRLSRRTFTIIGVAPRSLEAISVAPVLMKPFEWSAESATPPWASKI